MMDQWIMQNLTKVLWYLLSGAFVFGAWSTTLEMRVRENIDQTKSIESEYQQDQKKLIDILGRMDERLKNLERR